MTIEGRLLQRMIPALLCVVSLAGCSWIEPPHYLKPAELAEIIALELPVGSSSEEVKGFIQRHHLRNEGQVPWYSRGGGAITFSGLMFSGQTPSSSISAISFDPIFLIMAEVTYALFAFDEHGVLLGTLVSSHTEGP